MLGADPSYIRICRCGLGGWHLELYNADMRELQERVERHAQANFHPLKAYLAACLPCHDMKKKHVTTKWDSML
jgi:hypothetical protein